MAQRFLNDYGDRFRRTAAARKNHHARRGGLVEHVAQMMLTTDKICEAYPRLNRDLLLVGVLLHDCGKLWENSFPENGFSMPFSLSGELLGHIPIGMEVVNKIWRDIMDSEEAAAWKDLTPTNEEVRLHLLHLIGSHHGTHEFGSPVLPRTPEAIALHHIDNIDAKLEMMFAGYETTPQIAPGIYDRVFPLPGHLVEPLKRFPEATANTLSKSQEVLRPTTSPAQQKPTPAREAEQDPPESRSTEGNGWLFGG
jgi:3'-5' exoribonuclease